MHVFFLKTSLCLFSVVYICTNIGRCTGARGCFEGYIPKEKAHSLSFRSQQLPVAPQASLAAAAALGYPPEPDGKILSLMALHA